MEQTVMRASGNYQGLDRYFQKIETKKLFLICGSSIQKLKLGTYFNTLEARTGIQVTRFSDFRPNPLYEDAAKAVEAFRASGCDAIAAVGGGSAMDTAKCVKLWADLDPAENYLHQEITRNGIPSLAVPTTAGTGSEATRYAVIYYRGVKQSISHESAIPSAVLLDPSTLESLPEYHRKSSMLDALCHAVESFWSVRAAEESRELSRQAIQKIQEHMDSYLANTPAGNAGLLEAAHLAGKAIDLTQTTAGHAMCYKLTTLYGLAHGHAAALCVAKLWPYMAEKAIGTGLEAIFQELEGILSAAEFQNFLLRLELETPKSKPEDLEILKHSVNPVRLKNNPIPLDLEMIDQLYHQILTEKVTR